MLATARSVARTPADMEQLALVRMCSRREMSQWLTDTEVVKRRYPPPIIYLAILQYLLGRPSEACALLAEVERNAIGAWRVRAAEVADRLGCPSRASGRGGPPSRVVKTPGGLDGVGARGGAFIPEGTLQRA